jgi:hypothetical protein
MGTDPKGCFLGGMVRRSLVVFQGLEKVDFFNFSRNYSFGGVGWGVCKKQMDIFFPSFFLLCYGDLIKKVFYKN